jgi:hypothetical protein
LGNNFFDALIEGVEIRSLVNVPVTVSSFGKADILLGVREKRVMSCTEALEYGESLLTLFYAKVIGMTVVQKS